MQLTEHSGIRRLYLRPKLLDRRVEYRLPLRRQETLRDLFEGSGLKVLEIKEARDIDIPQASKGIGLGGLIKFMIQAYPKLVLRLIRDQRFREAQKIDNEITKMSKEHMGYALIIGQKPG